MAFKDDEIETAKRFLIEIAAPVHDVLNLKEFARRDPDPAFAIEQLDNNCPDVVVITENGAVGMELTAYSNDVSENRLSAVLSDVYDAGMAVVPDFVDLYGFQITISPSDNNTLRQRDARPLVAEVLEFVRSQHRSAPFAADEDRHYSVVNARRARREFAGWPILDQQLWSITVHTRSSFQGQPAELYGGFASHFGTRLDRLTQTINSKASKLKRGYTRGVNAVWLLIHADGNPRSSRIAPMWPEEIRRLLDSAVSVIAKQSGFDRVFLWDGVRGGFVDLVSADFRAVQRN